MIGGIGIPELLIILVIVLLIFGAGKLPMIGGNIGKAIKNFKSGVKETQDQIEAEAGKGETVEMENEAEKEKTKA